MIYTVGHTIQSQEDFLKMVLFANVDCIIDVRSMPYSKHAPLFNQENIKKFLNQNNILYAHFGKEFGARRNDCLAKISQKDGTEVMQVNFELAAKTDNFRIGINRLDNALSQNRTIALMCTESNPLACHRFSFLSRFLYDNGYNVEHIIKDKQTGKIQTRSQKDLEAEMISEYLSKKSPKLRLTSKQLIDSGCFPGFIEGCTEEEQRIDAYRLKNREIGYIPSQSSEEDIID